MLKWKTSQLEKIEIRSINSLLFYILCWDIGVDKLNESKPGTLHKLPGIRSSYQFLISSRKFLKKDIKQRWSQLLRWKLDWTKQQIHNASITMEDPRYLRRSIKSLLLTVSMLASFGSVYGNTVILRFIIVPNLIVFENNSVVRR